MIDLNKFPDISFDQNNSYTIVCQELKIVIYISNVA